VFARNQGGLLDIALHPKFAENQLLYFTYATSGDRGNTLALGRGRLQGHALTGVEELFVADAWSRTEERHFGSRLAFATDGSLFKRSASATTDIAPEPFDHAGKVLRLNDGSI
jgi:glucose/arabinose dehydrogenase